MGREGGRAGERAVKVGGGDGKEGVLPLVEEGLWSLGFDVCFHTRVQSHDYANMIDKKLNSATFHSMWGWMCVKWGRSVLEW